MGGELEDSEPEDSDSEGDYRKGEPRKKNKTTYTEQFYEVFPWYLAMGMTYDEFWNKDCKLTRYYRKANKIRKDIKNQDAWVQGLYLVHAINASVIGRSYNTGEKYPDEPLDLYGTKPEDPDKEKKKMLALKEKMMAGMNSMNAKFKN